MPNATDSDGICLNIFRECHTAVARVAQMMDIRAGHLAHQCNLADGSDVCTLLRSSDGCNRQAAKAVVTLILLKY